MKHRALTQFPTRAKAEKAAETIRASINEPVPVVTFSDLADRYIADVLPTLRLHTQKTNLGNLKYLRDKFDDRRLDAIKPIEIQNWLNDLKTRQGKEMSRQTRQHIRNLAHNMWRLAMMWEYVSMDINPISLIKVTKGAREKPRC